MILFQNWNAQLAVIVDDARDDQFENFADPRHSDKWSVHDLSSTWRKLWRFCHLEWDGTNRLTFVVDVASVDTFGDFADIRHSGNVTIALGILPIRMRMYGSTHLHRWWWWCKLWGFCHTGWEWMARLTFIVDDGDESFGDFAIKDENGWLDSRSSLMMVTKALGILP